MIDSTQKFKRPASKGYDGYLSITIAARQRTTKDGRTFISRSGPIDGIAIYDANYDFVGKLAESVSPASFLKGYEQLKEEDKWLDVAINSGKSDVEGFYELTNTCGNFVVFVRADGMNIGEKDGKLRIWIKPDRIEGIKQTA